MRISSYLFIAIMLLLASSLMACSNHLGNVRATDQSIIEKIKIGKTTKNEVLALLGDAQGTSRGGGKDTWMYYYSKSDTSIPLPGGSARTSSLAIIFNQESIVEDVRRAVSTTGHVGY